LCWISFWNWILFITHNFRRKQSLLTLNSAIKGMLSGVCGHVSWYCIHPVRSVHFWKMSNLFFWSNLKKKIIILVYNCAEFHFGRRELLILLRKVNSHSSNNNLLTAAMPSVKTVATMPTSHKVQNKDTSNSAIEGRLSGVCGHVSWYCIHPVRSVHFRKMSGLFFFGLI